MIIASMDSDPFISGLLVSIVGEILISGVRGFIRLFKKGINDDTQIDPPQETDEIDLLSLCGRADGFDAKKLSEILDWAHQTDNTSFFSLCQSDFQLLGCETFDRFLAKMLIQPVTPLYPDFFDCSFDLNNQSSLALAIQAFKDKHFLLAKGEDKEELAYWLAYALVKEGLYPSNKIVFVYTQSAWNELCQHQLTDRPDLLLISLADGTYRPPGKAACLFVSDYNTNAAATTVKFTWRSPHSYDHYAETHFGNTAERETFLSDIKTANTVWNALKRKWFIGNAEEPAWATKKDQFGPTLLALTLCQQWTKNDIELISSAFKIPNEQLTVNTSELSIGADPFCKEQTNMFGIGEFSRVVNWNGSYELLNRHFTNRLLNQFGQLIAKSVLKQQGSEHLRKGLLNVLIRLSFDQPSHLRQSTKEIVHQIVSDYLALLAHDHRGTAIAYAIPFLEADISAVGSRLFSNNPYTKAKELLPLLAKNHGLWFSLIQQFLYFKRYQNAALDLLLALYEVAHRASWKKEIKDALIPVLVPWADEYGFGAKTKMDLASRPIFSKFDDLWLLRYEEGSFDSTGSYMIGVHRFANPLLAAEVNRAVEMKTPEIWDCVDHLNKRSIEDANCSIYRWNILLKRCRFFRMGPDIKELAINRLRVVLKNADWNKITFLRNAMIACYSASVQSQGAYWALSNESLQYLKQLIEEFGQAIPRYLQKSYFFERGGSPKLILFTNISSEPDYYDRWRTTNEIFADEIQNQTIIEVVCQCVDYMTRMAPCYKRAHVTPAYKQPGHLLGIYYRTNPTLADGIIMKDACPLNLFEAFLEARQEALGDTFESELLGWRDRFLSSEDIYADKLVATAQHHAIRDVKDIWALQFCDKTKQLFFERWQGTNIRYASAEALKLLFEQCLAFSNAASALCVLEEVAHQPFETIDEFWFLDSTESLLNEMESADIHWNSQGYQIMQRLVSIANNNPTLRRRALEIGSAANLLFPEAQFSYPLMVTFFWEFPDYLAGLFSDKKVYTNPAARILSKTKYTLFLGHVSRNDSVFALAKEPEAIERWVDSFVASCDSSFWAKHIPHEAIADSLSRKANPVLLQYVEMALTKGQLDPDELIVALLNMRGFHTVDGGLSLSQEAQEVHALYEKYISYYPTLASAYKRLEDEIRNEAKAEANLID